MQRWMLVLAAAAAAGCSRPDATCENAARHFVSLRIKAARGEEKRELRAKKKELAEAWAQRCKAAAPPAEQLRCAIDARSVGEAEACVVAAVAAGAGGGQTYADAGAPVTQTPAAGPPDAGPAARILGLAGMPDAGPSTALPIASAAERGGLGALLAARAGAEREEPGEPARAAEATAACQSAARHVFELLLADPEFPEEAKRELRADPERGVAQIADACTRENPSPEELACVMRATTLAELRRCDEQKGEPESPPPPAPEPRTGDPECAAIARHVIELALDSAEMKDLPPEQRKEIEKTMRQMTKELERVCQSWTPGMRTCVRRSRSAQEMQRCGL